MKRSRKMEEIIRGWRPRQPLRIAKWLAGTPTTDKMRQSGSALVSPLGDGRGWLFGAFAIALLCLSLTSCHGDYTPKPKAYPRVVFPEKQYELYDPKDCPFKFEKPVYANVSNDTVFMGQKIMAVDCWLNVNFPTLNGTINLTYKDIDKTMTLERLIEDAHKLSFKHTTKADYIDEIRIQNDHGVGGILYDVGGNAASNVQFFLTDSTHHFLRGALYFNNEPNTDSMAPVVSFVKEDMKHMLRTFQWK